MIALLYSRLAAIRLFDNVLVPLHKQQSECLQEVTLTRALLSPRSVTPPPPSSMNRDTHTHSLTCTYTLPDSLSPPCQTKSGHRRCPDLVDNVLICGCVFVKLVLIFPHKRAHTRTHTVVRVYGGRDAAKTLYGNIQHTWARRVMSYERCFSLCVADVQR